MVNFGLGVVVGVWLCLAAMAFHWYNQRRKSAHQRGVEGLLHGMTKLGIPRVVPDYPRLPFDLDLLRTWYHLLLEELWEYGEAAGLDVVVNPQWDRDQPLLYKHLGVRVGDRRPDLVKIVDACADIAVVNTGVLSLCGVADTEVMREVNANNLLKVDPDKGARIDLATGKLRKPPGHPKPDFASVLRNQGWRQVYVMEDDNGSGDGSGGGKRSEASHQPLS